MLQSHMTGREQKLPDRQYKSISKVADENVYSLQSGLYVSQGKAEIQAVSSSSVRILDASGDSWYWNLSPFSVFAVFFFFFFKTRESSFFLDVLT